MALAVKVCMEGFSWNLFVKTVTSMTHFIITKYQARKVRRNESFDKVNVDKGFRLTLNITYHPAIYKLKNNSVHMLLEINREHQNVFTDVPLVGFKKGKRLKDIVIRTKVRKEAQEKSFSKKGGGKRY